MVLAFRRVNATTFQEVRMKHTIKNMVMMVAGIVVLGLLFSCNPSGGIATSGDAAKELLPLRSLLSGVDASLGLIADADQDSKSLSRTVSDSSDVSLNGKMPSQVYADYGGSGTVRVPSTGYFNDFDGNAGVQAYFTMTPEGDYYRVKLYTYPAVDFSVRYNYEEYLVGSESGVTDDNWTYMDAAHTPYRMISYKSYFADGSVADRTIEFTSEDSDAGSTPYYDNDALKATVVDDILGSGNYDYPASISAPATSSTGNWSSKTVSTVDVRHGSDISATEYYTEGTDSSYSGVTYLSTDKTYIWGTESKSVIRFTGDTSGTSKERSLTTIGNSGSIWFTQTNTIDVTTSANITTYDKVQKLWYHDPSYAQSHTSSYQQTIHLVETGANTYQFTGYVKDFWGTGSKGNRYNFSITKNSKGAYRMKRSGWSTASRSIKSDLELELTKSEVSDDVFVRIPVGSGDFYGYYEHGSFIGVFTTSAGQQFSAAVDTAGISIDGTTYHYADLY